MHRSIFAVFALLFTLNLYASANPAQILLNAFSNQCPSVVNRQVQGSLVNLQALRSVVDQFRADDRCYGAGAVSTVLGQYNRVYQDYEVYQNSRDSKLDLQRRIALFTQLLEDPGLSASQVSYLQDEIIYAQADLIGMQTQLARFDQLQGRAPRIADQAVQSIQQFLATWSQNNACFSERRSLASSLLSNTFLATSAFAAPATALGLAAGALTIESISRFLNDFRWNNLIEDIDDVQLPLALTCVSEAVTTQYCEAHETQKLIRQYGLDFDYDDRQFEGLDLLARHLNRLDHWLKEVFAGSAITSEGDLINREKPILQAALLEKIKRYTQTYGTIRRDLYAGLTNPQELSDAIALGIQNLVSIMRSPSLTPGNSSPFSSGGGDDVENPIFLTRDAQLLPFQLLDPGLTNIPQCGQDTPCSRVADYVRNRGIILGLQDWEGALANALGVVEGALELVNVARSRTISVDSYTVLVGANQDFRGETNALQGLIKISENATRIQRYLTTLGCEERPQDCDADGSPRFTHLYFPQISNVGLTKDLTDQVITLIAEAYQPRSIAQDQLPPACRSNTQEPLISADNPFEVKSFQITSCITRLLKLAERGNDVFFTKVRAMVAYEMEARFVRGELTQNVGDLIAATRGDLVQTLLNTLYPNGEGSLSQVASGLEAAQYMGQETLYSFYDLFKKQIEEQFEKVDQAHFQRDELCLRFLPYFMRLEEKDKFAKKVQEYCGSARLQFYQNGPSVSFAELVTADRSRGPLGGRRLEFRPRPGLNQTDVFCALRRYYRKNYLYEQQRRSSRKELAEEHFKFVETW